MKKIVALAVLYYLRFWAKLRLAGFNPRVIGVTGSVGKTSTCRAILAILADKYSCHYSEHANSESGIPLDLLGITPLDYSAGDWLRMLILAPLALLKGKPGYGIYIAEMGVDLPVWPKNMDYLLTILRPEIGVFLNARLVHSENFKNLEEIAREKGKLIENLPPRGSAVVNADDQLAREYSAKCTCKMILYGRAQDANMHILDVHSSGQGFSLEFAILDKNYRLNLPGQILNPGYSEVFLAAIAVGMVMGIEIKEAISALERNFRLPPGRMSAISGLYGSILIDSSYNASKSSVLAALEVLATYKDKRKIALLGDMRELGDAAAGEHGEVAKTAREIADLVLTVGPLTKKYFPPEIKNFPNSYEAGKYLREIISKNDVVLIKGSQNTIFLEKAVEMLMAHPEDADKLLCRRGEFWEKKRNNYN